MLPSYFTVSPAALPKKSGHQVHQAGADALP